MTQQNYASANGSPTVSNASTEQLATVVEAAEILGITPDAVRSRLRRGTLERSPERGEDGEVLVVLRTVGNQSETVEDSSNDQSGNASNGQSETVAGEADQSDLVEALRDQIALLTRQLDETNRANSEHRRLLAAALERIPKLEAPAEQRNGHQTASEDSGRDDPKEPGERRSWWRRFFGFEA